MVTKNWSADISILIKPIWFNRLPTFSITVGSDIRPLSIDQEQWVNFKYHGRQGSIIVEHYGKTINDTDIHTGRDTAVTIEKIKFNGIYSPRFAWAGIYRPDYPQHYKQDQELAEILTPHTYLGWNGVWTLDFTLPIYTWIHKMEDLGWIYD